jgi:ubiquinone/menaquinone biosynthesis C-methylase UbiE
MPGIKANPMSDFSYRLMVWFMNLEDAFNDPAEKVKKAPIREGMTIIDYGCGPGRYTIPAAKLAGRSGLVYAVDVQPMALKILAQRAARNFVANIEPVLVDSFDTGLKSEIADMVFLIDVLTPIREHGPLLREVHRLIKPDGKLFMDSSHMSVAAVHDIVNNTGLFTNLWVDGKDMVWRKK